MKLLAEKNADLERQDIHGDTPFGNCWIFKCSLCSFLLTSTRDNNKWLFFIIYSSLLFPPLVISLLLLSLFSFFVAVSDIPEIRQYILDLKQQFTAPQSYSLTPSTSREDFLSSSESRSRNRRYFTSVTWRSHDGFIYSLSARRRSVTERQQRDVKRLSMREEKMMLQRSLEAEVSLREKFDEDFGI